MIKCKEDLVNAYIENDRGELRNALLAKCVDFKMHWLSGNSAWNSEPDQLNYDFIFIDENFKIMDISHDETDGSKRLTLSDFKPTRTEYVQVTESIFDLRDEFERGELYRMGYDKDYYLCENVIDLSIAMDIDNCYRKVEKEIDWRDEVMECLSSNNYHLSKIRGDDWIEIDQNFKNEEFLELCRVALRANGEIE